MSFDDYVNHISKKYRLAIAIAIIKSKPDNKTTERYMKELKQKFEAENMDSDDLDITICSDDFNIDDDNDITIFNDKKCTNDVIISENNINNDENPMMIDDNDVLMNDTHVTNNSITILNDFEGLEDVICQKIEDKAKTNEVSDVFKMLTDVDDNCFLEQKTNTKNPIQTSSQITYTDGVFMDDDATLCKSLDINDLHNDTQIHLNNKDTGTNKKEFKSNFGALNYKTQNTKSDKLIENVHVSPDFIIAKDHSYVIPSKYPDSDLNITRKVKEIDTKDSQESLVYTLYGLTDNYTHVSQSQNENIVIADKYIHGIDKIRNRNEIYTNFDKPDDQKCKIANINEINPSQNEIFTQHAQGFDDSRNNTQEIIKANDCNVIESDVHNENFIEEDSSDSQVELIPFKVIEELSKVKGFLNRNINTRMSTDGFSTDSGYKSDSQVKASCKSALQLSGAWVNQTAYSLFNFITICPLVMNAQEITNEISKVLGQLIDKLHEEEKYPSFLEELLESVDLLIRRTYEEDSCTENELLKKDESVQRILLLNKSINIQKFCIEKLTKILDEAHKNLTKDEEQYEILQINRIENLSYIFHLLEIILKRYMKCKDMSSQSSSQMSQEDVKLKRSSITDIWRKKWNPNYKEICQNERSSEKKCVLVECGEVLNKIIVNCMECYSLIAYAALQCFNLLQS